jgi:hypothetical protein
VFATTLAAALQEFDTEREQPEVAGVDRSRICAKHLEGNRALEIEVLRAPSGESASESKLRARDCVDLRASSME